MKTFRRAKPAVRAMSTCICLGIGLSACSVSNNPILGRVSADVGGHEVVVANCYRIFVPDVQASDAGQQFKPCKDAAVTIKDDMLFVNGESYGRLSRGDRVLVENGRAKIEPR